MIKHEPFYRKILREAWERTRTRPDRWILGFFAAFLGMGGMGNVLVRIFSRVPESNGDVMRTLGGAYPGAALVGAFTAAHVAWYTSTLILVVIVAIALSIIYALATCVGALIAGSLGSAKKTAKRSPLHAELARGRAVAWPLVALHVGARLLMGVIFMASVLPLLLLASHASFGNALLAVVAFIIGGLLLLTLSFLTTYATVAIVVEKLSLHYALTTGWIVVRDHWLTSIEAALLLLVVRIGVGIAIGLVMLVVSVPATLLVVAGIAAGSSLFVSITIAAFIAVTVVLLVVVGSALTAFELTTWTLLYDHLRNRSAVAKLFRLVHHIVNHAAL